MSTGKPIGIFEGLEVFLANCQYLTALDPTSLPKLVILCPDEAIMKKMEQFLQINQVQQAEIERLRSAVRYCPTKLQLEVKIAGQQVRIEQFEKAFKRISDIEDGCRRRNCGYDVAVDNISKAALAAAKGKE